MVRALIGFALLLCLASSVPVGAQRERQLVRVVVWDEQQPAQKQAYENFLGNAVADHFKQVPEGRFLLKSVRLDDPDQGLPKETLDNCDVLIWWGHARHGQVREELAKDIVRRIKEGRLNLIALHSAHWSRPFMEAMNERSIDDALKTLTEAERKNVEVKTIPPRRGIPRRDEALTPSFTKSLGEGGKVVLEVKLPMCVFPIVRDLGSPSHVRILRTDHPFARGVPPTFDIPKTEIYGAPFHVPTPDLVLFEERWDSGETFPGGCLWKVGKGQVFYFRPGHETYPIFKQPEVLKILVNAAGAMITGRTAQAP